MFTDLVGSTALSARMDPEDLRDIISAYQKCVAETVRRSDGFVAKYMGDGVLIYFGYPQAHEDDAERAVRAGLDLIERVAALKIAGSSASPRRHRDRVRGGRRSDRVRRSAGAQHYRRDPEPRCPAASVLQHPTWWSLPTAPAGFSETCSNCRTLGPRTSRASPGRCARGRRCGRSSVESRFEALHAGALIALVGREEELELLLRRWSRAKSGEGQVVLLSGEAGIGKSRLTVRAVGRACSASRTSRLRYFCSPQHTDSALYPVIGQMMRAAGFAHDDSPQAKADKLDALLAQSSTSSQDAALFAEMLSLPNDGRYPPVEVEPQLRRQKTLKALGSHIEALARINPVLMIFEDAHWTDPTSLELFARAVDLAVSRPALILVTFRPEFSPPWIGRPHVTALTLNRLTRRDIDSLIEGVVGNRSLPAGIRQDIIERTDGIPLFVEEMTKAVLDAEGESEGAAGRRGRADACRGGSGQPAGFADVAARPARPGERRGAGRRGDRPGISPHVAGRARAKAGRRIGLRPRPAHCGGLVVSTGHPAACELPVQACAGAGCGLQYAAAGAEARAACAHRRNPRKSVRGNRREPARAAGASLHQRPT